MAMRARETRWVLKGLSDTISLRLDSCAPGSQVRVHTACQNRGGASSRLSTTSTLPSKLARETIVLHGNSAAAPFAAPFPAPFAALYSFCRRTSVWHCRLWRGMYATFMVAPPCNSLLAPSQKPCVPASLLPAEASRNSPPWPRLAPTQSIYSEYS